MELKVWVEGIQRIVCGVTEKTTCQVDKILFTFHHLSITRKLTFFFVVFVFWFIRQDVVFALAHATGKVGRFTLIERWRNNERLMAPNENPLKVQTLF